MVAQRKNQLEVGQVIGWGTVIEPDVELPNGRGALLRCRCGKEYTAYRSNLKAGNNKSCGCARRKTSAENGRKSAHLHVTHGLSGSRIYNTWIQMMDRCHNEKSKDYFRYGARGIQVCPEWRNDVLAFVKWADANLGICPPRWSIDRIDNNGNYEPGNIRWANPKMQRANQREYDYGQKNCERCQSIYDATGPAQRFCINCK